MLARSQIRLCDALANRIAQSPTAAEGRLVQEALFEARNRRGATALSVAAGRGAREIAALLLEQGADLHHRDLGGATPLLTAVREGRRVCFSRRAPTSAQEIARILYLGVEGDPHYEPRPVYTGLSLRDRQRPIDGARSAARAS